MIRFLGNIEVRADAKGRVFIPATFRKQLQAASEERLIMRKDVFQDCLTLYPESVWNEELNELRSRLNKWNSKHQLIFRQFVSDVEVVTPDSNGRILIPKRYLQICNIRGDIRFIGCLYSSAASDVYKRQGGRNPRRPRRVLPPFRRQRAWLLIPF